MLFSELFRKRPELLKSNEQLTTREAIEHSADLLDFLIERQLERIGHFKLRDYSEYLASRIGFKFSQADISKLEPLYIIRNVIVHNSGLVRGDSKKLISHFVNIQNGELKISKLFLKNMAAVIAQVVTKIERHVGRKFYSVRSQTGIVTEKIDKLK